MQFWFPWNHSARSTNKPQVKVCGVTTPEDALYAAQNGADFIGMILWPNAKRSIAVDVAKEVAAAAREGGATPVGVFVDENFDEVIEVCGSVGIDHAQLHGDDARAALSGLPSSLKVIYVMNADSEGTLVTSRPGEDELEAAGNRLQGATGWRKASDWVSSGRRTVDYLLIDGMKPGSGEAFDWSKLKVPRGASRRGWILAGGLTPDNVAEATKILHPDVVDVSSGVTDASGTKKDPAKVKAFIEAVRGV
ncbi:hypothetical protein CYMTET_3975 [Cymbomonas tetramitiformis]|uniref:phosphoribosylanthranilate isomerase n=1 Tax=Cymbomonas tetramitiformis TaxID=36881 RepID=A0AAE0H2B8_9CHLO|nr:hypothetical protein CYMTET_3975 [Cymbomonas tetramitiformis]